MSDSTLMLTLSADAHARLERLSAELGRSIEDCARLALDEFIENWEDHLRTVAALNEGEEDRPALRVVND